MGKPPLATDLRLLRIQLHLRGLVINFLSQILCWEENSNHWDGSLFLNLPPHLHNYRRNIQSMFNCTAPLVRGKEDISRWDPTRSPYSIKAGYDTLLGETYPSLHGLTGRKYGSLRPCPK